MNLDIVILAAGKGSRMHSKLPKVLLPLAGRPLLQHVLDTAKTLNGEAHVVIGHCAEQVKDCFAAEKVSWVIQEQQLGTGHAVLQAMPDVAEDSICLVLYGDVPLVKAETLQQLLQKVSDTSMALLSVALINPTGYGRIIRNAKGDVVAIVEEKEATIEQRKITEVNTGILAIKSRLLRTLLPQLSANNAQKEFYLTDVIAMSVANKHGVDCLCIDDAMEVQGVNDKKQLAMLERAYQMTQAEYLMAQGVTLLDPTRIDIRGKLSVGKDVSIDVNCIFQGEVTLADGVSIGANCIIGEIGSQVVIGENVLIKANSIIEQAVIANDCVIGPFARLRTGTRLASKAKIGNFVETKKADIGEGSKVNHLSYIGDALIGNNVNVGAGTITCNYDGVNKFQTRIEDDAFIGSNTALVAPVTVGKRATVAAGSTVTVDVEDEALAVARARQKNVQGWFRYKQKPETN